MRGGMMTERLDRPEHRRAARESLEEKEVLQKSVGERPGVDAEIPRPGETVELRELPDRLRGRKSPRQAHLPADVGMVVEDRSHHGCLGGDRHGGISGQDPSLHEPLSPQGGTPEDQISPLLGGERVLGVLDEIEVVAGDLLPCLIVAVVGNPHLQSRERELEKPRVPFQHARSVEQERGQDGERPAEIGTARLCNEVFEVVDGVRANGVSLHGGDEERRIAHVPGAGQLRADSLRRGGQIMFGEFLLDPDRQGPFKKSSDHLHVAEVDVRTVFAHGVVPIGIPDQTGPNHVGNDPSHVRGGDPWIANG